MKKHLTWSNAVFVLILFLFLYKPSRIWMLRQISFAPSIESVKDSKQINDYNWQLKGLNAPDIDFNNLKGKVIFVNFWATWCPPCVAEMPSVQEFYNAYKDRIAFILITNEDWKVVEKFYQKKGYNLPVYNSFSVYPKGLQPVSSIPRTFVIDKNGFIRVDKTGAADWNSKRFRAKIDELLH